MSIIARSRAGVRNGFVQTFGALENSQYRLLWFGVFFSIAAMQIDVIARAWLAYDLTGSGLALGVVSAARGFPQIILSPLGGVAADRFDKRKLLVASQSAVVVITLITALLVHLGAIEIWHLAVLGLAQGVATPFTMPTRTALIPDLVEERQIPNALALESTGRNINRIVAPALAGVLLAWNPTLAFYAVAACNGASVLTLVNLPAGLRGEGAKSGAFGQMADGFRYLYARTALFALILLAFIPVLIGMPFQTLLPVFQQDVLDVSPSALGFMYTAVGVGAIIGSVLIAYIAETPHKGRIQMISGVLFGITLSLFALSSDYLLSIIALAFVGFFSTGYLTLNRVLVALQTERQFYGRVMSIYGMTWSLMPISLLPFGILVDAYGVQATVAVSGLLVAGIIGAIALIFSRYFLTVQTTSTSTQQAG